ncbi:unnamed protein product, partial [Iphiclides podalirius]
MVLELYPTDAARWYFDEITARVVAKSGNAADRFHLGKIVLQSLKDAPDFVLQIDGSTGESETCGSVLNRSVCCALSLRKLGIDHGVNIVIMAPNHLDLTIPFYAAMYLGLGLGCVDMTLSINELRDHFESELPKAVFCQSDKAADVEAAIKNANLDCHIITFDDGCQYKSLSQLLEGVDENTIRNFEPSTFNTEETVAFLVATSGTTGLSKAAEITHKNIALVSPHFWLTFRNFPTPTRLWFLPSPIQWLSAVLVYLQSPIMRITRLQSPLPMTVEHTYNLINKYKPTVTIMNPNMLISLLKPNTRHLCDFSSFEVIFAGGSAVPPSLVDTIKTVIPKTRLYIAYGMSEVSGLCLINTYMVPNSCGQIVGCTLIRLVDPHTGKDVLEMVNAPGEVWLQGPSVFKGYSNNPTLTKESFSEDGWLKSGDIFYRDANWNFFFVDRIKMLLKYRNHQISPVEIEEVIRRHPGVYEVGVTGVPHPDDGELPVACIVKQTDCDVKAKEIEDLVSGSLTDSKRLRGGVIFMNELPYTATSKINRTKLKKIACQVLSTRKRQWLFSWRPVAPQLVDPQTGKDVLEIANAPGEVWLKGPSVFKGYSNNPELTKESFSEDGWLKSGDIFYRDANWNFFFVDRMKMLLKYRNHQISPLEIEEVIRRHPGVFEVGVTGVPHPDDGELPIACIVKQTDCEVTAKEIQDLVSGSLTDSKQLRGGVIFMNELPYTATSKINRAKLKKIACEHVKQQAR